MSWRRDTATVLFAAFVAAGLLAIGIGWRIVARHVAVPLQVPALVSGSMGGLALVGTGLGFWTVHISRTLAAKERRETEALLDDLRALVKR